MISEVDIRDWEPSIEVVSITEREDGSADCELKVNAPAMKMLMGMGFSSLLKNAIQHYESSMTVSSITPDEKPGGTD